MRVLLTVVACLLVLVWIIHPASNAAGYGSWCRYAVPLVYWTGVFHDTSSERSGVYDRRLVCLHGSIYVLVFC
jgi:hypothetical protein